MIDQLPKTAVVSTCEIGIREATAALLSRRCQRPESFEDEQKKHDLKMLNVIDCISNVYHMPETYQYY